MSNSTDRPATRREFFRTIGRGGAVLAIAAAALLARRRSTSVDGRTCANTGPCRDCATFGRCELPRAAAARATLREQ